MNRPLIPPGRALVAVLALVAGAAAAAPAGTLPSVHVHYTGNSPFARSSFDQQVKIVEAVCNGRVRVDGSADRVGQLEGDAYYSRDGAYWAILEESYVAAVTDRCTVTVTRQPSKRLYHRRQGVLHSFRASGRKAPAWKTTPLPGEAAVLTLGDALEGRGLRRVATERADRIAGHPCHVHEIRLAGNRLAGEQCEYNLAPDGLRDPPFLRLAYTVLNADSGELLLQWQADQVVLNALVDARVYQPDGMPVSPEPASNPTRRWCEKQRQATGRDPCEEEGGHGAP